MDCHTFQTHADAFADGELEGAVRAEAADHVASCSDCAEIVQGISDMKSAVSRTFPASPAPKLLVDRVESAIQHESSDGAARLGFGRNQTAPKNASWLMPPPLMIPMGIAAAVVAAALWWWPVDDETPPRGTRAVPGQTVADIRQQHTTCVGHGGMHQEPGLPPDPVEVVKVLSEKLGLAVIVPDLSASGFEYLGAARCGIRGRAGAHALYRRPQSDATLSVFTVGRLGCLPVERLSAGSKRDYFFEYRDRLAVLAWHRERETYVVCGPLPQADMLALVERIHTVQGPISQESLAMRPTERP